MKREVRIRCSVPGAVPRCGSYRSSPTVRSSTGYCGTSGSRSPAPPRHRTVRPRNRAHRPWGEFTDRQHGKVLPATPVGHMRPKSAGPGRKQLFLRLSKRFEVRPVLPGTDRCGAVTSSAGRSGVAGVKPTASGRYPTPLSHSPAGLTGNRNSYRIREHRASGLGRRMVSASDLR